MADLKFEDYQLEVFDGKVVGFRQKDLTVRQKYDASYLQVYSQIEEKVKRLSFHRVQILSSFLPYRGRLLDFGCGLGHVVRAANDCGWNAWGYDLIGVPDPYRRLTASQLYYLEWDCVSFFDSLEHLVDPRGVLSELKPHAVMISVPCCHYPGRPDWFMSWKHRRPGEHLWHWNRFLLDNFLATLQYKPVMHSNFEDNFRVNKEDEVNILTAIYRRGTHRHADWNHEGNLARSSECRAPAC